MELRNIDMRYVEMYLKGEVSWLNLTDLARGFILSSTPPDSQKGE